MSEQRGDPGGEIRLVLALSAGRVRDVACVSTRSQDAGRMFIGLTPDQVAGRIGTIYSLCGQAQTIASLGAFEAAMAIRINPAQQAARDILRLAEMLSQTALRLCLGWTRALDIPPEPQPVRACLAAQAALEDAVMQEGWKRPGAGLARPDIMQATGITANLKTMTDTLLQPDGLADRLRRALAVRGLQGFGRVGANQPVGEGALSRVRNEGTIAQARQAHGTGLATRLEASLIELSTLPDRIAQAIGTLKPCPNADSRSNTGTGTASVETVRGNLTHALRLADGRVADYRITAPTEANFSTNGPLQAALAGASASDIAVLRQAAELLVLAIDPCVDFSIEVRDA
ncbi:MAG: hypothetical protein K8F59_10895 [Rhodobacteraceae bacterium]|nr:hypothetical protein [Paracoccaceae bacterium]